MNTALYIHGKDGSPSESEHYKPLFPDCEVIGLDYQTFTPWETGIEIHKAVEELKTKYENIFLIANSIGAFFCMNADIDGMIQKAYFISPVVDMEKLNGIELTGKWLHYVKSHPVKWTVPTHILYGSNDSLIPFDTISDFVKKHNATLTVMDGGEHWFHSKEQMRFLEDWIKKSEMLHENTNHRDIQLVIFDFDGTLGDTRGTIVATMQQTISELHLPEKSDEECAATIGLTLRNCFRKLFPQLSDEEIERCAEVYRRIFEVNKTLYKPILFPHVKETLIWLKEQGIKMTVASSRTSFSLHDLLESLEIASYFDYVLGAEDVTHSKPDPEPVLKTLGKMGVDAARTMVVGDMPVDIMMGARASCKTCGVTFGNGTREELTQSGAGFIINDMAELVGIIG